jgi:hypothetical protein
MHFEQVARAANVITRVQSASGENLQPATIE